MKVSSFFDIITDGNDLLELFSGVETTEQLISRLERLKRNGTEDFLLCLDGLRSSISKALNDTLEMNGSSYDESGMDDDDEDLGNLDEELASLDDESQNSSSEPTEEIVKKDDPDKA